MDMNAILQVVSIFFTCSTILIGGFSLAVTEPLKTSLSFLGIFISVGWLFSAGEMKKTWGDQKALKHSKAVLLGWLPWTFFVGWFISAIIHFCHWNPFKLQKLSTFSHWLVS
jgi:hypothetical protein